MVEPESMVEASGNVDQYRLWWPRRSARGVKEAPAC